jgi:polyhydroxybutyrate depolymerase
MTLPVGLSDDCATGAPLGVLLIQGTADPLVPYSGGRVTVMGRGRDTVLSADATLALFAARNRCTADSANVPIGAVDRLTWQGCAAPTRLDRVNGGGHTWPSGRHALPGWLVGPTNTDISAPDEIWAFFSGFPGRP